LHRARRREVDGHAAAMDRMYRLTRHVYDFTRAYYLLGRDRMLAMAATNPSTATLTPG
jgi:S-adenosylmethionine-diacylgycerolhomoserine-N-methlytransferase